MNKPSFIPKSKSDMNACSILAKASDAEIKPHLGELLKWLQDNNWPVARRVSERLQQCGVELSPEIVAVLKGTDCTWKYHVMNGLLLNCQAEVRSLCMDEVVRIINNPTSDEKQEEVDMVAKDVLVMYSHDA